MNYLAFTAVGLLPIFALWWHRNKTNGVDKIDKTKPEKPKNGDGTALKTKVNEWWTENKGVLRTASIGVISLIVTEAAIAVLIPDLWEKLWRHQDFFWMGHVCLGIMVALQWFDNWSVRWGLRVAMILILITHVGKETLKAKDDGGGKNDPPPVVQIEEKGSIVKILDTPEKVRFKIKLVRNKGVIIRGTGSYRKWVRYYDPDYDSLGNRDRLYKMITNESSDPDMVKREGLLPNGTRVSPTWNKPVRNLEFFSDCIHLDKNGIPLLNEWGQPIYLPVYLIVGFDK